ncbi:unnamed protein product [Cuscuta epithymum]|uniref:AT3G52170-like helix-turn-helix domain-containing protein n=1 Tax=Cuscuta epithymum TaxID=186058 RepID=A0AAV0DPL8_9ASTE|nr:unnamed protein product [Cuscuta epithymum]CAH9130041.1 unnamed protein product [Cuscuta epithymum]
MHTLKGAWAGQTFAVAACNESGGRKARIRRSKEERKSMVETFIKKFQKSNNGRFPSLNLTHKEVGGSFYIIREIVREIIQENRVLGPAMLPSAEQDNGIPVLAFPIEPYSSLSSPDDIHYHSTTKGNVLDSNGQLHSSRTANNQLDVEQVVVVSSDIIGLDRPEDEQNDEFFDKDEVSVEPSSTESSPPVQESVGETGELKGSKTRPRAQNEQNVEFSDKDEVSVEPLSTESSLPLKESVGETGELKGLKAGPRPEDEQNVDLSDKDEVSVEPSSTESSPPAKESVGETGELKGLKAGPRPEDQQNVDLSDKDEASVEPSSIESSPPVKEIVGDTGELKGSKSGLRPEYEQKVDLSYKDEVSVEPLSTESPPPVKESVGETGELKQSKAVPTHKNADVVVEMFPLRPISMTFDDWDENVISETSGHTLQMNAEVVEKEKELAVVSPLQSSSDSSIVTTPDFKVKDSSAPETKTFISGSSSNRSNEKFGLEESLSSINNREEDIIKVKNGPPPLDRINLETWKGTEAETATKHDNNPLLALFKSFLTAIAKILH